MERKEESGKKRLIKGTALYLWEELKTMNKVKLRALKRMISGYLLMKFKDRKTKGRPRSSITLIER